jgi:hypothetical protein
MPSASGAADARHHPPHQVSSPAMPDGSRAAVDEALREAYRRQCSKGHSPFRHERRNPGKEAMVNAQDVLAIPRDTQHSNLALPSPPRMCDVRRRTGRWAGPAFPKNNEDDLLRTPLGWRACEVFDRRGRRAPPVSRFAWSGPADRARTSSRERRSDAGRAMHPVGDFLHAARHFSDGSPVMEGGSCSVGRISECYGGRPLWVCRNV